MHNLAAPMIAQHIGGVILPILVDKSDDVRCAAFPHTVQGESIVSFVKFGKWHHGAINN